MIKSLAILFLVPWTLLGADIGSNLILGTPSEDGQIVNRVGYAFCYSEKHEQPLWVTYELTKREVLTKVAKRKDNFRKDPLVKTGSAILDDYKGSPFDRGHLAPAADMAWSEKAMSESFYLSNMSPQNPGLNRGMWAGLEKICRNWSVENGKVHIITGPIIRENYSTIGPNKVTVPQWYYKICVSVENKKAIAFLIPNRKPQRELKEFLVSIDKLEEITGLDFLDKLDDSIEEKMESHSDIQLWNFGSVKTSRVKKSINTGVEKTTINNEGYYLSGSGKRHNSKCRYFKKANARSSDGTACKICGG